MGRKQINKIPDEVIAAFLDGQSSAQETLGILESLSIDPEMREMLRISQIVDAELGLGIEDCEFLPMTAMAASFNEDALCCIECEKYILSLYGIPYGDDQLMNAAVQNGWFKETGTALHNVGRHLECHGLIVTRRFKSSIADLVQALKADEKVIVAVDGGELSGDREQEKMEDMIVGKIPDHTVVVLSVDEDCRTVRIYDPNSLNSEDEYSLDIFEDAWDDSMNYMVSVAKKGEKAYDPKPIDLSDVVLPDDLNELREAIAENAHDVWALERKEQGWTYGPSRDDTRKETPCMVPYSQLPDSEKKFDRDMAMNTLKLLRKLGYDIVKREDI